MFTIENFTTTYGLFNSLDQNVFELKQSIIADNKKIKRYSIFTNRYMKNIWHYKTRNIHGFETFEDALALFNKLWSEGRAIDAPLCIAKMISRPIRSRPGVSFWTLMANRSPQIVAEYDKENPLDDTEQLWTPGNSSYGLYYIIPPRLRQTIITIMNSSPGYKVNGVPWGKPKTFEQAFTLAQKV